MMSNPDSISDPVDLQRDNLVFKEYQSFAKGVARVLDSLERAGEDASGGGSAIAKQIAGLLFDHGIRPVAKVGDEFNPEYHEVVKVKTSDLPVDQIVEISEMGYEMLVPGQMPVLLRPARVLLSGKSDSDITEPQDREAEPSS